jgi:hypothetical protein
MKTQKTKQKEQNTKTIKSAKGESHKKKEKSMHG